MVEIFSLLLLALAVSLDSFGVGLTYGLRKMKLPFKSLLFIAFCSAASILLAMTFGNWIQRYLSPQFAEALGGIILILIGAWALYQVFRPTKNADEEEEAVPKKVDDKVLINLEIKMLGLVIRILRKPMEADIDKSGTITGREAILLGVALSLDAFGAGIGAALIGFSPWLMALTVAIMSASFVTFGMKSGYRFSDSYVMKKFSFIPGLLLIILGVWSLI
ncbi:sporulation membrane protein YtaF [Alkalihalobacterium chitinilyticum]|uniref:Sporulation membrane protein YtaF n=1 Tax=Alkalihalobacterium chitinilyticum TaxID=2980103 RepID=A0ABT5VA62_9BACI|nr:sporulation membrane protein YtaF [Alkalihalobacterium chitinilyticum]MDE5412341.1 sporulation membrane protein YtaF [Alkalihalobacterium chitinilyticum]